MFDYILGKRVAGPGNCNPAYSFFPIRYFYIMGSNFFKNVADQYGEVYWQLVKRPGRRHDFQKFGWKFWIEEGIAKRETDEHCPLAFCPLTGHMMALNVEDMEWFVFVNEDFVKAYNKWAKKKAEELLIGK